MCVQRTKWHPYITSTLKTQIIFVTTQYYVDKSSATLPSILVALSTDDQTKLR